MIRIDVLPDTAGHWSVTRDRVVDAEFDDSDSAVHYAASCAERARRKGQAVRVEVFPPLEQAMPHPWSRAAAGVFEHADDHRDPRELCTRPQPWPCRPRGRGRS